MAYTDIQENWYTVGAISHTVYFERGLIMSTELEGRPLGYAEGVEFCLTLMVLSLNDSVSSRLGKSYYIQELDECYQLHFRVVSDDETLTDSQRYQIVQRMKRKHADLIQAVDERFGEGHKYA